MNNKKENYLDVIPVCNPDIKWSEDGEGIITLEIENKGIFNRIAQKLFKKPPVSYVHLDRFGSFVWKRIDGKKDVYKIAAEVENEFGEEANPLYERIVKYFNILESYGFVVKKK